MNRLQQQKENKSGLLEDMLSFIHYTPNREADLLAFMEKYQKADCDERPTSVIWSTSWRPRRI